MWRLAFVICVAACVHHHAPTTGSPDAPSGGDTQTSLGAHWTADGSAVVFRVASTRATRIELDVFAQPTGAPAQRTLAMTQEPSGGVWTARVAATDLPHVIYYGYRVWGPNWPYDASWQPGSQAGWLADVDADGNRMNPNKLVFDPYAEELSHDPLTPTQSDGTFYATGSHRAIDSAPVAPKGIVLVEDPAPAIGTKPTRALRDDVVYEVHVRGFTEQDPSAGACAGTYAGAATRAAYLGQLGVTAVEFLPIAETQNDRNDVTPGSDAGQNYWGYSTLAYFAPDRRFACDRSPGGPTKEFRAMVAAFHAAGIKVFLDVVYNHTAEGGGSSLLSLRGIDNAGYYQLDRTGMGFTNSNGVGADLAAQKPLVQGLVLDSLRYWRDAMGVDGFRFDLAPVLGNACGPGCFRFDPNGLPTMIAQLGRAPDGGSGVDLIAEPWAVAPGSYSVGKFPAPWSEWNDKFRDTIKLAQNQQATPTVTPGAIALRIAGSTDVYAVGARTPAAGVSYLVSHDGFTLHDLYACNAPNNAQGWPYGPSSGGSTNNISWDQGGDPAAQRQAVRTGLALELLSAGVPMITGGDELGRTLQCNNNPYDLDSPGNWLDWSMQGGALATFAQRLLAFRAAHAELRRASWSAPIHWLDPTGGPASDGYLADATQPVIAWQVGSVYVAYNRSAAKVTLTLPAAGGALAWYRAGNTAAFMEAQDNFVAAGGEQAITGATYDLDARAVVILLAK